MKNLRFDLIFFRPKKKVRLYEQKTRKMKILQFFKGIYLLITPNFHAYSFHDFISTVKYSPILRTLVMPLRASNIAYNDLRHVILVANKTFMEK